MADAPRLDRLTRDELLLLQRQALRRWRESDALARDQPRAWQAVIDLADDAVRVALGAIPGYIVMRSHDDQAPVSHHPDLLWDTTRSLPFEDATVDDFHVDQTPPALDRLVDELARTLKTSGRIHVGEHTRELGNRLTAHGFRQAEDDPHAFEKVVTETPMADDAPQRVREMVLGDLTIRTPRMPLPSL